MNERDIRKYESLKRIVTAPADVGKAEGILSEALSEAVAALGIEAASAVILNKDGKIVLNLRVGDAKLVRLLDSLEQRMISSLRSEFGLENIYSTLSHEGEKSLFSYMIKAGEKNLGAISGICEGKRNIAMEEEFISVIATALKNLFGQAGEVDSARVDAVKQTTITLNHEINNPLTVVLGNVQLLLMKGEQLPEEVKARLELIEQAGLRIRDAVAKLIKLAEVKSTTYVDKTKMIDIQDSETSDK